MDAQSLAAALKGPPSSGLSKFAANALLSFEVDAPRTTQRSDRSVSFSMNATPRVLASSGKPPGDKATASKPAVGKLPTTLPAAKKGKR